MEQLAMETTNLTDKNIEKILEIFPNVLTEGVDKNGKIVRAIDFEKLKQELSHSIVDGEESFDFTWVGKKEAMLEANRSIRKTLRPQKERSLNWETTENIYIEGDNLEALKILQESYLGAVKMIYIDPPYNTGNDFVYRDNFTMDKESYDEEIGIKDEQGNKLFKNSESNGRFHSYWCSMIYPRLKLARNLLSDDGVIFISIDEHEINSLKNIGNEVFGYDNFVGEIIRKTKSTTEDIQCGLNLQQEYLLIYAKNKSYLQLCGDEKTFDNYKNPDNDPNGAWCSADPSAKSGGESTYFPIQNPYTGQIDYPPKGRYWAFSKLTMEKYIQTGKITFKKEQKNNERGFIFKRYKDSITDLYNSLDSLFAIDNIYMNQAATKELKELFDTNYFNYPKPVAFIKKLCKSATKQESIILDFFSGSATTAHAVMQLNTEDGGNRKFIMVQLPEVTDEKSEAYKAGYKSICEIGEERIRRAGKKIQQENPDKKLDIGFRVFKVDDTNMKDVYYSPNELKQSQLGMFESNIKDERTDEDLLYEVLLNSGVELSLPHKVETIDEKRVHFIQSEYSSTPDLIACFEEKISENLVRTIAGYKPTKVVFRDSSFNSDANRINVEEIFKLITPDTRVKVL